MIIIIVTFCGHGKLNYDAKTEQRLLCVIENLIIEGATEFVLGGYGNFDILSAKAVKKLKSKYPAIKSTLVIPYLNCKYNPSLYDDTVYPPLEDIPPRHAIPKRNQWMVQNSQVVVAYVKYNWGGAAKTLLFAEKKKKRIINIGD